MAKMGRPKVDKPREHTLSFRLKDEDYSRIKNYATSCDMTITQLIEAAIKEYLDKQSN